MAVIHFILSRISCYRAYIPLLAMLLVLTGCSEVLYSNMDEKDVNEIMALLLKEGIECQKIVGTEGQWSIRVGKRAFSKSMAILKKYGLPRDKFKSIGDVFEKTGIISSPSEERIRFLHALSQEMSETISCIDGVITARVQIVLPQNNPFAEEATVPSSASVFIKHRKDVDITPQVMKIKELVVKSVEGLSFQNVTVALFPAEKESNEIGLPQFVTVYGLRIASDSVPTIKKWFGVVFTTFIGLAVILVYRFASGFKKRMIGFSRKFQTKKTAVTLK